MRGQHFTVELLRAAVGYARSHGAQVIEGFPVEPRMGADGNLQPATYRHMGDVSIFRRAGFRPEIQALITQANNPFPIDFLRKSGTLNVARAGCEVAARSSLFTWTLFN